MSAPFKVGDWVTIDGRDGGPGVSPAVHEVARIDSEGLYELSGVTNAKPAIRLSRAYVFFAPIELLLWCPECGARHVDEGEFASKEHHTHACQQCGMVWRPAVAPTRGVRFLPGFKSTVKP